MSFSPRSSRHRARQAAAGLAAATVAVVVVVGATAGPVAAAPDTVNPLAGAGGFTTVSFGDTILANHELEGSVAVGGNLVLQTSSPYNIIHRSAGNGNYVLPMLDGSVPLRLVVDGHLDRAASTNQRLQVSDESETLSARRGQVRLGDTSGDSVTGRGIGVCVQAPTVNDCSNDRGAVIEQSKYPQSVGSVRDGTAFDRMVPASAIADLTAASDAITAGELDAVETVLDLSGSEATLTLTAGRTNLVRIDPALMPTGMWKVRFGPVPPSATTPVVFQVKATNGATLRLPSEFIGFNPGSGGYDDIYARYVLWNVDQPAGSTLKVTSSGIVPGSWLAPHGTLRADFDKTLLEGQIVAKTLELFNSGEVHHFGFDANLSFEPSSSATSTATASPDPSGSATSTPAPSGSATSTPAPSGSATSTPAPSGSATSTPDPTGRFGLQPIVSNPDTLAGLPADYSLEYTTDDGATWTRVDVPAGETLWIDLPVGTTVQIREVAPPTVDGGTWAPVTWIVDDVLSAVLPTAPTAKAAFVVTPDTDVTLVATFPVQSSTAATTGTDTGDVLDDPSGDEPTSDETLAQTGLDALRGAGIGALVILAGAALLAVRRRATLRG